MNITFNERDALLVVDLQYDFMPDGALHVPEGDKIIPLVNTLPAAAQKGHATIIASRDWHPTNNSSFKEQGGPWDPHCVQNTHGASFHKEVKFPENTIVVSKGFEIEHPYSAFDAKSENGYGQSLPDILKQHNIQRVIIAGLALDYCVKASCLDAIKQGFETLVVLDATRAITAEDGQETVRVLKSFGIQLI